MCGASSARSHRWNQTMTPARSFPALAICATLIAFASPSHRAIAETNQTLLHGAGSTFSAALYNRWIETYHREHPAASITYDAVGSGEGVRRFVAGSVDFAATDDVLS